MTLPKFIPAGPKPAFQPIIAIILAALCCLLLSLASLSAAPYAPTQPVVVKNTAGFYQPLKRHVEYLRDPSLEMSAADAPDLGDQFLPIESKYIDLGLSDDRLWLRFKIYNNSAEAGQWRLDIGRQYMQELSVYARRHGGSPELIFSHGESDGFGEREIDNRYLVTDIAMDAGEAAEIYVSFRSTNTTFLPLAIGTVDGVYAAHNSEFLIDWLFNGALFGMVGVSLLLIPLIGWRLGVAFAAYIAVAMFYVLHADGYTFQYFWPERPWLNDPVNLAALLLMPAAGLTFARQLFGFSEIAPRFDRVLLAMTGLTILTAALAFVLIRHDWFMIPAYCLVPVATTLPMVAGVIALRSGRIGAVPYLIGALIVVSSIAYAVIAHLLPGQFNIDRTLDYGHFALLCETVAFAIAMVLRFLGLRNERDRALQSQLSMAQEQLGLHEELSQSRQDYAEARRLSELRSQRLSSVSHDIRQPLISLRNALEKLRGHDEQATAQMYASFDYLEQLATDELDKGGQLDGARQMDENPATPLEDFPLHIVLDNIYEIYGDTAKAKGLDLRYRPADFSVRSDPMILMRAVSNLVSNALANTETGGVLLAARRRDGGVRVEIWDSGVGMDDDELSHLMARGKKGGSSSGEGLGLALVQESADAMGWNFEIHSRKGRGTSTFIHIADSQ